MSSASKPPLLYAPDCRVTVSFMVCALIILALYLTLACYHARIKPLPYGLDHETSLRRMSEKNVCFLADFTFQRNGKRITEHVIFDQLLSIIQNAENHLFLDFFLFNAFPGRQQECLRPLCAEVTQALLARKQACPEIEIVVVTDPINEVYGGVVAPHLEALRRAGIPVVLTQLNALRDPNPIYSTAWRMLIKPFGRLLPGRLPHPFSPASPERIGLQSWMRLLNFKANHRKVIVADAPAANQTREMVSMVMSANPHDASSANSNVALLLRGPVGDDLLASEQTILYFSPSPMHVPRIWPLHNVEASLDVESSNTVHVGVVTEQAILRRILEDIYATPDNGWIDMAMFYLAERNVIHALATAARRGVNIRILLDPNLDAFGWPKSGIPNRPVAAELLRRGKGKIAIRKYLTHGEQFHSKMMISGGSERAVLILGSANLTRRNVSNFNLELDVVVVGTKESAPVRDARRYFERLWSNTDGEFSVDASSLVDASRGRWWRYWLQEQTGLGTF